MAEFWTHGALYGGTPAYLLLDDILRTNLGIDSRDHGLLLIRL